MGGGGGLGGRARGGAAGGAARDPAYWFKASQWGIVLAMGMYLLGLAAGWW